MNVLGYKSGGHDATLSYLQDGKLVFSIEAEKDSGRRHALFEPGQVAEILERWRCEPHLLCGDSKKFGGEAPDNYVGYRREGILRGELHAGETRAPYISVPHEMSHIACSYALSDIPERTPFYALVWEGYLGRFYRVDEDFNIAKIGDANHVMDYVGIRYSFPYHATARSDLWGHSAAGKIMALAGLAADTQQHAERNGALVDELLDSEMLARSGRVALDGDWRRLYRAFEKFRDVEVTDPEFVSLCKSLQDGVFERFRRFAEANLRERLPLVISGGCGLNCDWNTMWRDSGLFESVFVPPVTNDCGIAIGAAAVVQHLETGRMKLDWDVYAGETFVREPVDFAAAGFVEMDLDNATLAQWLQQGLVIAWIQGRYEMGARALCHRSLIASPFTSGMQDELNRIKNRERFRPVAPVCLEEDVSKHFAWSGPSPYMLYFQKVKSKELEAITHADGTARVQTVNRSQDRATYDLLRAFRDLTGYGVLCNTSLNFLGRGFINRTSDIVRYVSQTGIPAMVIDDKMYIAAQRQAQIRLAAR